jgi:diacylglycerol kinase family enzyme
MWWETEAPGHAAELGLRAASERRSAVAVWGGDGTYNEVARGLVGSDTALLALPGGTTSVLAHELGIPRDPCRALVRQLDGARRELSVARTDRGQIFLLMLSAGPDAVVLSRLSPGLKARCGKAGIALQALREFIRGNLPRFEVRLGATRHDAAWCIVGNGRLYGGPWAATPGANLFSPGLEVVTLTRHGRGPAARFLFAIPSGRHLSHPGVERCSANEVVLAGDETVPYQLDGDPAGHLPVAARATRDSVWVLLPGRRS